MKPHTHKRWTLTLGSGEGERALDVVVENTYEADVFMELLVNSLTVESHAYGETFTPETAR